MCILCRHSIEFIDLFVKQITDSFNISNSRVEYCTFTNHFSIFSVDDTIGESDSSPDMDAIFRRSMVGSGNNPDTHPLYQSGLINPFKPYCMSYKLTLFRHLWLHTFPTDPRGDAMQEHHQKVLVDHDGVSPSVSCC